MDRTSKRRGVWGAVGLAVAAAAAAFGASSHQGCAVYDSSLIGSPDAGDGDAPAGNDAGLPACILAHPPDRPRTIDGGDDTPSLPPIVAAFNTIDIGVSGPPDAAIPPLGYDLDNTCTLCPGGQSSCQQPAGASPPEGCDDDAGRDNGDIRLFRALPQGAATMVTSQLDQGLAAGQFGMLIRISNYNGTSDDPLVNVDFFVSNGLERDDAGGIPTPKGDGTDRWTTDPESWETNGQPTVTDPSAYVTPGETAPTLVAHFNQLPITFGYRTGLGGATMQLTGAVFVGTLLPMGSDAGVGIGFGLTGGTIAGRWPTRQMLSTLATIPLEGGFLCGTDPDPYDRYAYIIYKNVLCLAADISSTGEDKTTPLAPCDAISVGMAFTAKPAQLGDRLAVPPAPSGCHGGGDVLWSDQCP